MIRYAIERKKFRLNNRRQATAWIKAVCESKGKKAGEIQYIFTTDERILAINQEFLKHDYFTDIITFDYTEDHLLSGDIFISVDTVQSNAAQYKTSFEEELRRVIIHGVLHLAGYKDKKTADRKMMRAEEDAALQRWHSMFDTPSPTE